MYVTRKQGNKQVNKQLLRPLQKRIEPIYRLTVSTIYTHTFTQLRNLVPPSVCLSVCLSPCQLFSFFEHCIMTGVIIAWIHESEHLTSVRRICISWCCLAFFSSWLSPLYVRHRTGNPHTVHDTEPTAAILMSLLSAYNQRCASMKRISGRLNLIRFETLWC